ncbi:hypothetical protein TWF281_009587 [Arthrobotrys megalospora]
MSTSPRPETVSTLTPVEPKPTSDSGSSTVIPQGGRLEKHPKATEAEAAEAAKEREATQKLAAKKLSAIQKLAELTLDAEIPGTKRARKAISRYLGEARDVSEILGPEFESVIVLKVMRGIESKSLKEAVAAMMWDKDWKLQEVANVLKASVDGVGTLKLASLILEDE